MAIELGLGAKCMRGLFILFNCLFALVGVVIMSVGAWLYATGSTFSYVTGNNYASGAAIIIACGVFTAAVCGFGALAAICKSRIMLGIFIAIWVAIIIAEVVGGILGFIYLQKVNSILESRLQSAIDNYGGDPKTAAVIDDIQNGLKCCGVNSYTDYQKSQNPNSYYCVQCTLPTSCNCPSTASSVNCTSFVNNASLACGGSCNGTSVTSNSVYSRGCLAAWNAEPLARKITYIVGGFGVAVGLFEILGVLVACGLICCITSSEKHTLA